MNVLFRYLSIFLLISTLAVVLFHYSSVQANSRVASNWRTGMSIYPASGYNFDSPQYQQQVLALKATGANSVSLVIPYYQTDIDTTDLGPGEDTPTNDQLRAGIRFAHQQGMQVFLKPHPETYSKKWRGQINPEDRAAWFTAYENILINLSG